MTPIRPVSDEHRHEPADYEVLLPISDAVRVSAQKALWNAITECGGTPTPDMVRRGRTVVEEHFAAALATRPKGDVREAHRSCCAEEREVLHGGLVRIAALVPTPRNLQSAPAMAKDALDAATAIRSNSHD